MASAAVKRPEQHQQEELLTEWDMQQWSSSSIPASGVVESGGVSSQISVRKQPGRGNHAEEENKRCRSLPVLIGGGRGRDKLEEGEQACAWRQCRID